jgi:hypothetical protein
VAVVGRGFDSGAEARSEELPERDAELSACFEDAEEGIPALFAVVASCGSTDLAARDLGP